MATILKSSRYIRCLNLFARRIIAGNDNRDIASKCLTLQIRCINSYLNKSYATVPAIQRNEPIPNFDKHFVKLDENIQRFGRVFKIEVEDVLAKIREAGYVSSLDGLLLIRCCGELMVDTPPVARTQLAREIWNTLETLKIPMDVSHFNALLRVYLENNNEISPIEMLTKMKEKGIEPNRVTYQRLILYKCRQGDIEGATKILEFMREKGLPLNEGVFNALITGHSEANDMESAINVINVMNAAGIVPGSGTYTALMCAHAKRGDVESIKKIIADCGTKELYIHDKELFEVIQVLGSNGHDKESDELLSMMPKGPNYNFDALHAILKVLDTGNVDIALKILPTMRTRRTTDDENEENDNGTFLIRKLVNSKFPAEKIIEACRKMEQEGQHARASFVALERSLLNGDTELSPALLKFCTENGATIREHYLWPILAAHGRASNYQGVQNTIKLMTQDLKVEPGIETLTDYVLPYAVGQWDDIVATFRNYGIPEKTIVNAIAVRMLMDKKIRKTANFMTSYPSDYEPRKFYRPLSEALRDTEDHQSFAVILRLLHESDKDQSGDVESVDNIDDKVVDAAVRRVLLFIPYRKQMLVDEVLNRLIDVGLGLSPHMGEVVRQYYRDNLTDERIEIIDKLTSGTLVPVAMSELKSFIPTGDTSEIDGGNQDQSVSWNMNFAAKKQLLTLHLTNRDAEGVDAVTKDLEAQNFKFSPAVLAQIIDVFCSAGNLEKAEKWMTKCQSENPGVMLDLQKTTAYAALLIKNGRFDDAIQLILDSPRKEDLDLQRPGLKKLTKRLLDAAAETGDVEKTNRMFEVLTSSKYAPIDNFMLGPLVKVHLIKGDLEGALQAFEKACEHYRCTPLKNELSKKFIDAEDATSLQRLTDLSTQIHGESNSLVDLVLSFIECGRSRQARKILETPGLRLRTAKLKVAANRYLEDDKPEYLEPLFELTKGLPVFDRHELYDVLLDAHTKKNDWRRGLSLWTEMQEEDIQPSQDFLHTLATLLRKNNQPIPFIHDETQSTAPKLPKLNYEDDFLAAIKKGDLDSAEQILRNAPSDDPQYSTLTSQLVEEILRVNKDVKRASRIVETLITKASRLPRASALKAVWNALIETGEYNRLRNFDKILSATTKRKFRFFKYMIRANIKEMGIEKFLTEFESRITELPQENLIVVKNHLHYTTLLAELKKNPDAFKIFMPIAEKLAGQGIHLPINVVWCYYFEKNLPEAEEIWSKHMSQASVIIFSYLIENSKKNNDVDILERLYQKLKTSETISVNAKCTTLSHLVEAYDENGRHDDVIRVLEGESTEVLRIFKTINASLVYKLRNNLKANGKSFPSNVDQY